jgi:hypothetical protein
MAPILAKISRIGHSPAEAAVAATTSANDLLPDHASTIADLRNSTAVDASPSTPPTASASSGLTCIAPSPSAISPTIASHPVLMAERPSFHSACRTAAITTGLTPYSSPATAGILP